ncbi:MAG: hypothetical protein ACRDRO_25825 [Pseudonocardiaceae bacterium]
MATTHNTTRISGLITVSMRSAGFWEFPTVSMGLGPLNAIYQARFNRYLHHRGITDISRKRSSGAPAGTSSR